MSNLLQYIPVLNTVLLLTLAAVGYYAFNKKPKPTNPSPEIDTKLQDDLTLILNSIPQLAWTCTPEGVADWYSDQWYEYTGMTKGDVGNAWYCVNELDREASKATWEASLVSGKGYEIEYRLIDLRTKTYKWFLTRANCIRDKEGKIVKWFGTCTDINEMKTKEDKMMEDYRMNFLALQHMTEEMKGLPAPSKFQPKVAKTRKKVTPVVKRR